jgi:hypothetical protein
MPAISLISIPINNSRIAYIHVHGCTTRQNHVLNSAPKLTLPVSDRLRFKSGGKHTPGIRPAAIRPGVSLQLQAGHPYPALLRLELWTGWFIAPATSPARSRGDYAVYDRKADDACSDDYCGFSTEVFGLVDALLEALCELVPASVVCRWASCS